MDANVEEVEYYENTFSGSQPEGEIKRKPKPFLMTVHDPTVPANLNAEGITVAPGYETTILITPKMLKATNGA